MGNMDSSFLQVAVSLLVLPLGKGVSKSYSAPVIKLEGRQFTEEMLFVYQLECSTTTTFHGCSVEMLLDDVTKETIRYFNYTCFTGKGVCSPLKCACADECNRFFWNYTVKEEISNQTFKCDSRMQDNDYFYRGFASGFFKGGDFFDGHNAVEIVSKNQLISQKVLTEKESTDNTVLKEQQNNNDRGILIAVLCLVCLQLITYVVLCVRLVLKPDKVHRADVETTDCRIATYDELSPDEDTYSEESHQTCSMKRSSKYTQSVETCRSNTEKSDHHPNEKKRRRSDKHDNPVIYQQPCLMSTRTYYRIATYDELSPDEYANSEDNHPIRSKRKSSANTQFVESCGSNKTGLDAIRIRRRPAINADKVKHKQKRSMPACTYCHPDIDFEREDVTKEELRNVINYLLRFKNEEKDMYSADVSQDEDDNYEKSDKTDEKYMLESEPFLTNKENTN